MSHVTNGKENCGFWTWTNILKFIIAVILFIMAVLISPITENIRKTEKRVTTIERVTIPEIKSEISDLRGDYRVIKTRQEAQIETLKEIAEDVKWLRRVRERRNE